MSRAERARITELEERLAAANRILDELESGQYADATKPVDDPARPAQLIVELKQTIRGPSVPADEWTDDEWLAVMGHFEPDAPPREAERWVGQQRQKVDARNTL